MIKKAVILIALLLCVSTLEPADEIETKTQKIRCLGETIWREARGEPILGKIAVAVVVLNRTRTQGYHNTVCGVVLQKGQFPWTKYWKQDLADQNSLELAAWILDHKPLNNWKITHFHNHTVNPRWKLKHTITIGNHHFYE